MTGIEMKHGYIYYFGNPAGYIKENIVTVDKIFQSKELEVWLVKQNLIGQWKEGIFERLSSGENIMEVDGDTKEIKNLRIWQLKADSEFELRFKSYEEATKLAGEPSVHNYEVVYDGEIETNDLEAIYAIFNAKHPVGFTGHSLSMSDVVELYDDYDSDFYYVDRYGFEKIKFKAQEQKENMNMNL